MKWLVGLLLFAGGCDVVFRIDRIEGDAGTVSADAAEFDASLAELPAICTSPVIFDPFDLAMPVCPWGTIDNAGGTIHDSVIDFHLDGTGPAFNGCTAYDPLPFTTAGVYVYVPTPLMIPSSYTKLGVREAYGTTPTLDASIVFDGTNLLFVISGNTVATAATKFAWWRIRQPSPGLITASVSGDGVTWIDIDTESIQMPRAINIDIGAGITGPTAAATATFGTFGVCN